MRRVFFSIFFFFCYGKLVTVEKVIHCLYPITKRLSYHPRNIYEFNIEFKHTQSYITTIKHDSLSL